MTDKERNQVIKLRASGYGYSKIAEKLGISVNTIKSFCKRNAIAVGVETKPEVLFTGEVTRCENCGKEIHQIAKRKRKRFCSDKCRNTWWNNHLDLVKRKTLYDYQCPYCKKTFHAYGDSRRKYCSHQCYIADRFGDDLHD